MREHYNYGPTTPLKIVNHYGQGDRVNNFDFTDA